MSTAYLPASTVGFSIDRYLSEIDETPLLNGDTEHELALRVQDGDAEARDHMVRANLRLVVRIARDFLGRGLGLPDLIQEGNLGLLRAVEGFDPDMCTRFSTYASYWIRQSIQRAVENTALPVRIPAYAHDLVLNWRRTTAQLQSEIGRVPAREEVAKRMKLTKKQLKIVEKALRIFNGHVAASSSDCEEDPVEQAADLYAPTPEARLETNDELRQVMGMLDKLPGREADVLRLRFGLGGDEPLTLNQVGERLHLTRERVRQIERDALKRLRELVAPEGDE